MANWKKRDRLEFLAIQQALVEEERWIIEGCSIATLETRFARADTVIYLKLPRLLCLYRALKRIFCFDRSIPDLPEGCSKGVSWTLICYLWNFEKEKDPEILALARKYPRVDFWVWRKQREIDTYIANRALEKGHSTST